jgi:hypothetical protein
MDLDPQPVQQAAMMAKLQDQMADHESVGMTDLPLAVAAVLAVAVAAQLQIQTHHHHHQVDLGMFTIQRSFLRPQTK